MESFRRGIFRSPRNAWLAVAVYTSLLYATLTLVYDGYIWAFERIGPDWISRGLNSAYFVAGLALLAFASLRGRRGLQAWAALAMIAGSAAFCLWLEEVPANRLHLEVDPLVIDACIEADIEVLLDQITSEGVLGADRAVVGALRTRITILRKA